MAIIVNPSSPGRLAYWILHGIVLLLKYYGLLPLTAYDSKRFHLNNSHTFHVALCAAPMTIPFYNK